MSELNNKKFCKQCGNEILEGEFCKPKDTREITCRSIYYSEHKKNETFHLEGLRQGKPNMTFVGKL